MDRLSEILKRFNLHADVYFTGNLCSVTAFTKMSDQRGHLHILKSGGLQLYHQDGPPINIAQPSALFFPTGHAHQLAPDPVTGADLITASIQYQDPHANPIAHALPDYLKFQLSRYPKLKKMAKSVFKEAFGKKCAYEPITDRLCDIFIIHMLKEVLDNERISYGMFAGLAHPELSQVIVKIHAQPEYPWSLDTMAEFAFMSRSKFADLFRDVMGETPGEYLTNWRMTVAQSELRKGSTVGQVAEKVGYENGSALARAFRKSTGVSPKAWQKAQF